MKGSAEIGIAAKAEGAAVAPPAVLSVSLFGGCALSLDGREIPVANKKGRAIIGYLAFTTNHRETRERLAGLFWGDTTEEKARTNLRQALKSLRDQLEAAGFNGFDTLYAAPGFLPGTVRFDVVEALESIGADWPNDALLDRPRIADSLLAGFEDVDPSFRDWLMVYRESLSRKLERELQDRLSVQTQTTAAAARLARALLQTDPTHEPAARTVMRWQMDNGDSAGAIAVYNRLRDGMENAHGQPTDPETDALIVAIKDGSYRPSAGSTTAATRDLGQVPDLPSRTNEKLLLIIGKFEHMGQRKELTFAFRHELMSRLAKFREWLLVDGDPPTLPVASGAPCYTLSAPLMESDAEVSLMLSLKDSRAGTIVWGERFSIELKDFFKSLQEIIRQIAAKLNVYISVERLSRVSAIPDISLDIYDRWILGQWLLMQWSPNNRQRARQVISSILQDAPEFSHAYSSLAQMDNADHIVLVGTFRTIEVQQRSLLMAQRAVQLDPLDSRAHLALAWANAFSGKHDVAEIQFSQARALNEDDAWTATSAALGYAFGGNVAAARLTADKAMRLIPVPSAIHWCYQSNVHFACGELQESLIAADRCGDAVSNMPGWRAAALALLGRRDEARREAQRFVDLMRSNWSGGTNPTPDMVAKWFLHCFPIKEGLVLDSLRQGLSDAGLPTR